MTEHRRALDMATWQHRGHPGGFQVPSVPTSVLLLFTVAPSSPHAHSGRARLPALSWVQVLPRCGFQGPWTSRPAQQGL